MASLLSPYPHLSISADADARQHYLQQNAWAGEMSTTVQPFTSPTPGDPHPLNESQSPYNSPFQSNYEIDSFELGTDEFFGISFDAAAQDDFDTSPESPHAAASPGSYTAKAQPSHYTYVSSPGPASGPTSGPTPAPSASTTATMHSVSPRPHISSLPDIYQPAPSGVIREYSRSSSIPNGASHHAKSARQGERHSLSSHISPPAMSYDVPSPRLTITNCNTNTAQDLQHDSDMEDEPRQSTPPTSGSRDSSYFPRFRQTARSFAADGGGGGSRGEGTGYSDGDLITDLEPQENRHGVAPQDRNLVSDTPIESLKDGDKRNKTETTNRDVEEWRSQAGESTDDDDELAAPNAMLSSPFGARPRAKSTGAIESPDGSSPRDLLFPVSEHLPSLPQDPHEGEDILPVDDAASFRENRKQEGRYYINTRATGFTPRDERILSQPRIFNDGVSYLRMVGTVTQPASSTEAMKKFNEQVDALSLLSRSATWGTRRWSESSTADNASIFNGGFVKSREKKERKLSLVQQLANRVRTKSESKPKNKRGYSDGSTSIKRDSSDGLAPPSLPSSNTRPQSPRINTNVSSVGPGNLTRTGSGTGSLGGSPSVRNIVGNVIRRVRSRSDVKKDVGLFNMIKAVGGPPAPHLTLPSESAVEDELNAPEGDHDIDDDEDEVESIGPSHDESLDDYTIVPTFEGFREHIQILNPKMNEKHQELLVRIAHQQTSRYKSLLNKRLGHAKAVATKSCAAQELCVSQGGAARLLTTQQGKKAVSDFGHPAGSDQDSNPEGRLTPGKFPPGVPMPSAKRLPAVLECTLCFTAKNITKPSDWTKHVHEDIQPFTCTFPNCGDPKTFKRKADWVRHENELHRHLEWWTCDVSGCSHTCYRRDNFLQHLSREHKYPEPTNKAKSSKPAKKADDQTLAAVNRCHQNSMQKSHEEPCKFCGDTLPSWKKLSVHLAKHMEMISLPVIRLVQQQQIGPDTLISPVGPPPVLDVTTPAVTAPAVGATPEMSRSYSNRSGTGLAGEYGADIYGASPFEASPYGPGNPVTPSSGYGTRNLQIPGSSNGHNLQNSPAAQFQFYGSPSLVPSAPQQNDAQIWDAAGNQFGDLPLFDPSYSHPHSELTTPLLDQHSIFSDSPFNHPINPFTPDMSSPAVNLHSYSNSIPDLAEQFFPMMQQQHNLTNLQFTCRGGARTPDPPSNGLQSFNRIRATSHGSWNGTRHLASGGIGNGIGNGTDFLVPGVINMNPQIQFLNASSPAGHSDPNTGLYVSQFDDTGLGLQFDAANGMTDAAVPGGNVGAGWVIHDANRQGHLGKPGDSRYGPHRRLDYQ